MKLFYECQTRIWWCHFVKKNYAPTYICILLLQYCFIFWVISSSQSPSKVIHSNPNFRMFSSDIKSFFTSFKKMSNPLNTKASKNISLHLLWGTFNISWWQNVILCLFVQCHEVRIFPHSTGHNQQPFFPPNTVKLHNIEWSFIVASLRHTCAIIMLCNQHLDITNTDLDRFVNNNWEK